MSDAVIPAPLGPDDLGPDTSPVAYEVGGPGGAVAYVTLKGGEDGSVENRVIALPKGMSPSALIEAGNYMSATLGGLTLADARTRIERELADGQAALDGAARTLVERGIAVWSEDADRRPVLIVRGQGRLIDADETASMERKKREGYF